MNHSHSVKPSTLSQFGLVFRHEGRVLLADRSLWLVAIIFLSLLAYGVLNGIHATGEREHSVMKLVAQQAANEQANLTLHQQIMAGIKTPDPFGNPTDPMSMGGGLATRYAIMPTLSLSAFAFGQSDMLPHYFKVTNRSKATFMYDSEIENPWNLLSDHVDLAFVLIYIFPLLIFSLSYNLLSAEREHGTMKLLLSQPLQLRQLVLGKVAVRALPLWLCATVVPVVMLLSIQGVIPSSSTLLAILAWIAIVTAYGLFWFALAVLINAFGKSSAFNALFLIASWVVLVLVLPVVLNIVVGILSPAPSRIELATRTRTMTIEGLNRYSQQLSTDYRYTNEPDVLQPKNGKIEIPARRLGHFYLQKDVDAEIQTVLDRFATQLAQQQALVDRFGMMSPAIVVAESTAALAGNGSARHLHFQDQVDRFHQQWKLFFEPRIINGIAITEEDLAQMPRFVWKELPTASLMSDTLRRLFELLLPAGALLAFGFWRLRRYAIV
jgi:ABC-2 type transport system permease protein